MTTWQRAYLKWASFDGSSGRWPGFWYRYLDWRLSSMPELAELDPVSRREVLYASRRRRALDPGLVTLRIGNVLLPVAALIVSVLACWGLAAWAGPTRPAAVVAALVFWPALLLACALGGKLALMRLPSVRAALRAFREDLARGAAAHLGETEELEQPPPEPATVVGSFAVQPCGDPRSFLDAVRPLLERRPVENERVVGTANACLPPENRFADATFAVVQRDGAPVGAVLCTPPRKLLLTGMPPEAAPAVADFAASRWNGLPGVQGPRPVARAFAAVWCRRTGARVRSELLQEIRVLTPDRLRPLPSPAPGELRLATPNDLDLLTGWRQDFSDDGTDPRERLRWLIAARRLVVWDDGGPRSMSAVVRLVGTGCSLSLVYTPPAERRRGYGQSLVTAHCRHVFDEGAGFACLHVGVENRTAVRLYRRIGFRRVGAEATLTFRDGR